jgi:hypothetical protein
MKSFDHYYCFKKCKDPIQYVLDRMDTHYINFGFLSQFNVFPEAFIEKFQDKVDWYRISAYQTLSEAFVEKFKDKVDWKLISGFQTLSEAFIEKFQDRVDWERIIIFQTLSEAFIEKFQDKVEWRLVFSHQALSKEFIDKFQYKTEEKYRERVAVNNCGSGKRTITIYLDNPELIEIGCFTGTEAKTLRAIEKRYNKPILSKYKEDYLNKVKDLFKRARELTNAKV